MTSRCSRPRKPQRKPKPRAAEVSISKREGGVVEGEFVDGVAQVFEFGGVDGEEAAEHHRLRRFEARQRGVGALLLVGDGVADAGVADLFDRGGEEADFAGAEFVDIVHLRAEHAEAVDVVDGAGWHHRMRSPFLITPVDDADQDDDAEIAVIPAVDQHRLQRRVAVALGGGQAGDDGLQHFGDADAGLGRDTDGVGGVDADHVLDLFGHAVGLGGGQVDLVQDGHDFVIGVDGLIDVGEGLRLDPLGASTTSSEPSTARMRAGDLIGEIDVAGGVDQVQDIGLAVLRPGIRSARCWP